MKADERNACLARGELEHSGLLPALDALGRTEHVFEFDIGLDLVPAEPGILLIRGARQYGKSTWLERELRRTIEQFGAGTAYHLNGDTIRDLDALEASIEALVPLFATDAPVRRLFIDEITAVDRWEIALKRLADAGTLRHVLVVTTGSKATDLRRGSERLPGRKGRLDRTNYLFTPISFMEFARVCGERLGDDTLHAYLLSGGCPAACNAVASTGRLPEYVTTMIRDWIYGECLASGRNRSSLISVMHTLIARGGAPVGQTRLAREAGLANNTVAAGYVELLSDLMAVASQHAWDPRRRVAFPRKRAKFPFINTLAAVAWDEARPRSVAELRALPTGDQGRWLEWLVAQEVWRRAAIRGDEIPERLLYWRGDRHEIDFVVSPDLFVEVKRGRTSPIEYAWFPRTFPHGRLVVVGNDSFRTDAVIGVTLESFLTARVWE